MGRIRKADVGAKGEHSLAPIGLFLARELRCHLGASQHSRSPKAASARVTATPQPAALRYGAARADGGRQFDNPAPRGQNGRVEGRHGRSLVQTVTEARAPR